MIKCTLQYFLEIKSTQTKSNVGFRGKGLNLSIRRKTSQSRVENQQTQPTYDAEPGDRTQATLYWWKASVLTTTSTLLLTARPTYQQTD